MEITRKRNGNLCNLPILFCQKVHRNNKRHLQYHLQIPFVIFFILRLTNFTRCISLCNRLFSTRQCDLVTIFHSFDRTAIRFMKHFRIFIPYIYGCILYWLLWCFCRWIAGLLWCFGGLTDRLLSCLHCRTGTYLCRCQFFICI